MADEEVTEGASQETSKKYITATLDKDADADLIAKYGRLAKIGGFAAGDVFRAGVDALVKSDQYQNSLKALQEELNN